MGCILLLTTHGFLKILIKCSDSLPKIPHKKSKKISIPKETIVSTPYKTISKDEQREFQVAAIIGDKEKIEFFLNKGMNPNSEFSGKNPLKSAIFNDNSELVKLLLENGANPNFRFVDGSTPLIVAAHKDNPEIVELLLQYGADVKIKDTKGITALTLAKMHNCTEVIELLSEKKTGITKRNTFSKLLKKEKN